MLGLFIPFFGTVLGAGCVFFMRDRLKDGVQKALLGFASGVMVAASVWSLLIPAIDSSENLGKLAFLPAASGFIIGMVFLFALDKMIPHLRMKAGTPEGPKTKLSNTMMLVLAVTLHNIPEGMAVGVMFAGALGNETEVSLAAAYVLATGIGIQNFPEGAIISMPLRAEGSKKAKAFIYGVLSGIVEPVTAGITLVLAEVVAVALPYMLSFAAGAMIYVVIEELLPEASADNRAEVCTLGFAIGFTIMMVLDVALG